MSPNPPVYYPMPAAPAKPPGWWGRNWKWFVPCGCLSLIALIIAFVAGILMIVFGSMKSSDAYKEAVARATSDPRVISALGDPVKAGWFLSGNINVSGDSGEAGVSIPISGPKGKGTIYAKATKSSGAWNFDSLQVAVEGSGERIDLLHPQ